MKIWKAEGNTQAEIRVFPLFDHSTVNCVGR